MSRPGRVRLLSAGVALLLATQLGNCPRPGDIEIDDQSERLLAATESNADAVTVASSRGARMLARGDDQAAILAAVLAELEGRDNVAGAGIDETSDTVWVDFINGEGHCFMFVDQTNDPGGDVTMLADETSKVIAALPPAPPAQSDKTADRGQAQWVSPWRMPGNNQALLVNGLNWMHADWAINDTTAYLEPMLTARGYDVYPKAAEEYDVFHHELTVDMFDFLNNFGLIVIEAHGQVRKPQYPLESMQLPPGMGPLYTGTCGGALSNYSLLTTTPVTDENLPHRLVDVHCGRLVIWDVALRQEDGKIRKYQFYGVTPNYVREHVAGKFPNNTIFVLNACRGYGDDWSSPFAEMLFEKCDEGAQFLGWTSRVWYPTASRAVLNLFQLMTVANYDITVASERLLRSATPPHGGSFTGLTSAWAQLDRGGWMTDRRTGAVLLRTGQGDAFYEPILMPHPMEWDYDDVAKRTTLGLLSDNGPAITIGGTAITAEPLAPGLGLGWKLYTPVGAFGDIVVAESGRTSINRPLHRWRPQITITGKEWGGMQYTITFTLQARATVRADAYRTDIWSDPPPATFSTYWDLEASVVGWQFSGSSTTPGYPRYTWSGSGLRALSEVNGSGEFRTNDAGTLVDLAASAYLTYNTFVDEGGSSYTMTSTNEYGFSREDVPLGPDWTVAGASYDPPVGVGDTVHIEWNAFTPTPPFDPSGEPR